MNEDKVGYKNPPKQHRFQKGVSGNPLGSSGPRLDPGDLLRKELETKVRSTENGRSEKISKKQVIAKRLVRNAASGKWKDVRRVLKCLPKAETTVEVIGYDSLGNRIN